MNPAHVVTMLQANGAELRVRHGRLAIRGDVPTNLKEVARALAPQIRALLEEPLAQRARPLVESGRTYRWSPKLRIAAIVADPPGLKEWRTVASLPSATAVRLTDGTTSQAAIVTDVSKALRDGIIEVCGLYWTAEMLA